MQVGIADHYTGTAMIILIVLTRYRDFTIFLLLCYDLALALVLKLKGI